MRAILSHLVSAATAVLFFAGFQKFANEGGGNCHDTMQSVQKLRTINSPAFDSVVKPPVSSGVKDEGLKVVRLRDSIVDSAVTLASDDLLAEGLNRFLRYDDRDLLRIENLKEFSRNILGRLVEKPDNMMDTSAQLVEFSKTEQRGENPLRNEPLFAGYKGRIYAHFSARDYGSPHALVRWTNISENRVVYFQKQLVNPYSESNFVWLESNFWESGQYRVDVYREDEILSVLAAGTLDVY